MKPDFANPCRPRQVPGDQVSFVCDNPKATAGHFLLGYHYIIIGGTNAAKKELAQAVAETPKDQLAERLLKRWQQTQAAVPHAACAPAMSS